MTGKSHVMFFDIIRFFKEFVSQGLWIITHTQSGLHELKKRHLDFIHSLTPNTNLNHFKYMLNLNPNPQPTQPGFQM